MSARVSRVIHVVAGVLIDGAGRVLIAQRPAGKHLAGGWEFPGGKLEPGEARAAGLARELREELGIVIGQPRPLLRLRHTYPYGQVLLDVWVVRRYRGEPQGLDGQQLRWCRRDELAKAELLPADRPILMALRLPERLRRHRTRYYRVGGMSVLRARRLPGESVPRALLGVLCRNPGEAAGAAAAGADFLVMRKVLSDGELAASCRAAAVPLFARGISLARAWTLGASGINVIAG
ncbi:MAG: 8-oxo-dGTP diphosphatase MutT [Steroidobacteraceae bacterium]